MSYLKMALAALQATTSEGEAGARGAASSARRRTTLPPPSPPKPALRRPPVTCAAACPRYELNPWTRDPALGAWCHYRMEHLVVGGAACEEFSRGEVPSMQPYKQATATTSPTPPEKIFTCADCSHFEANHGPNPGQSWGRCLKRNKGRSGCATACQAALNQKF